MQTLINFITNGSAEFTPQVMVGLIVFVLILDGLCMLIGSITGGIRK